MHLEVTFKNLRPREELRRRAQALFVKLERFMDPAADAQLVVDVEHGEAVLEIVVNSHGEAHKVREEDADLRTALDRLFHTLEERLRRRKERRVERHRGGAKQDGFVQEPGEGEDALA